MRKTGIIFVVLVGISALFLFKASDSGKGRAHENTNVSPQQRPILQQISPRFTQNTQLDSVQPPILTPSRSGLEKAETSSELETLSSKEILARLIGKWEQTKSNRKQILTIKKDGIATMVVEPKGFWKTILGSKVTIDIEWSLSAGTLTFRTIGGNPENKLEYIKQVWGDQFTRKINSLEDKMFTLRDEEGEVSQEWIRTSY